jgi:lysozyme family protein
MNRNWDKAFDSVIVSEGGYANLKDDPGGPTNHGCTQAVWEEYVGHKVTIDDIKALTIEDVKPLYKKRFWDAIHGDALPSGLDYCIFDCAINSGTGRAAKFIQEIVGVPADGAIGNNTVAAITQINPVTAINEFCDKRQGFLESLKTFPTFGKGWTKRVQEVRTKSLEMAN